MVEACEIMNGVYDGNVCEGLFVHQTVVIRGHDKKIYKQRPRLDIKKYTFCNRVVNNWNSLPDTVVNARSVLVIERKLDRVWKCQRQKWDYTATIENTCLDHNDHLTIEPNFSDSELESQLASSRSLL